MKKALLAASAAALVAVVAGTVAWAAAGDSSVVHACVGDGSRIVRIPANGAGCGKNETAIDWNAQGPQGPAGPQGASGPAGTGPSEPNTRLVAFLHVQAQKQGTIDGESTSKGHEKWIEVLGFTYGVTSPRDAATGQASGKRQHHPLVITKPIDKSTPKLFAALVTNELLPAVQLDFVKTSPDGTEQVAYSIKLRNAEISEDQQRDEGKADGRPLETVSFTFQKIELDESGVIASDDWEAPAS
jgi:type VI secretion system secreted protein Hcp